MAIIPRGAALRRRISLICHSTLFYDVRQWEETGGQDHENHTGRFVSSFPCHFGEQESVITGKRWITSEWVKRQLLWRRLKGDMKFKDLSFILVRVLALYSIVRGIELLINIIQIMYPLLVDAPGMPLLQFRIITFLSSLTGLFMLGVGLFIWTKTTWIVRLISRDHEMSSEELQTVQNNDWYTLGLTLIGVYVFIESCPNLINLIGQLFQYSRSGYLETFAGQRVQIWLQIGAIVLKLILAAVLVLKAAGVSAALSKIRGLGLNTSEGQNRNREEK
jgi:hypothetical protein